MNKRAHPDAERVNTRTAISTFSYLDWAIQYVTISVGVKGD